MQLFQENIIELWNEWEVRVLILFSLLLQVILTIFGARRKYAARVWIRMLVWSAYMTADWVATVVLGILARSQANTVSEDSTQKWNNVLHAFWAPFLLLHLGGPDTITAYSLEDNELWSRHFLGLIVQLGLAFYIFVRSWGNTSLTYITIPVFITGIIKYGERTYVLRSSSSQYFKDCLLSDPDPGPDFRAIYLRDEQIRKQQSQLPRLRRLRRFIQFCLGCREEANPRIDERQRYVPTPVSRRDPIIDKSGKESPAEAKVLHPERLRSPPRSCCACLRGEEEDIVVPDQQPPPTKLSTVLQVETIKPDAHYLEVAYFLFKSQYLFADLILSYKEREDSYSIVEKKSAQDAFKLVAVELGFIYDELYTKATIVCSLFGILVRFISFCCSISALVSFSIIIDIHSYPLTDVLITYILMIGAVVLEVYAVITLLLSDWTKLYLIKSNGCGHCQSNRKRWSECMGQYSLISSCLQNGQPLSIGIEKLPWIGRLLEKYQYLTWKDVTVDLKDIIFKQLLEKSNEIKGDHFSIESCRKLLDHRGDAVLKRYGILDQFRWSISDVEFDRSLLLWHIATDAYYYSENKSQLDSKGRKSKALSDYMLYLLVFCPSMLPEGIAEIRYRDSLAECMRFFEVKKKLLFISWKRKPSIEKTKACEALLRVRFGTTEEEIKGDKSQSVLFYGCRLSEQLRKLRIENDPSGERKWEMISEVWVEMLTYAANKCRWKEHGQQLRKGGELLTHVHLLMAHLGLSEQYRIQKRFSSLPREIPDEILKEREWLRKALICIRLLLCCFQCLTCQCCEDYK